MSKDPDPTLVDDDSPELSRETILAMRPAAEVLPSDVFSALVAAQDARAGQGATITLEQDVIERLQSMDDDWRGRAAALLRKAVGL